MSVNIEQYQPVKQEDEDDRASSDASRKYDDPPSRMKHLTTLILGVGILLSICLNVVLGVWVSRLQVKNYKSQHTAFAGMSRTHPVSWRHHTPYTGTEANQTGADLLWNELSVDAGAVALTDVYTGSMNLPEAQRFPWDDTKGIYLLNGYHSLHCLIKIRRAVRAYHAGLPLPVSLYHVYHCLDALRQEVLCDADDTPRYTGMGQADKSSATYQIRQCRDWNQMKAWADSHSACWRYADEQHEPTNRLEQYRFCPDGSPYNTKIEDYFNNS
ncbi:hypothetical protein MMC27_006662 [Xylographa pallens]|nr:hypothetical protein [Xylographa pallens]